MRQSASGQGGKEMLNENVIEMFKKKLLGLLREEKRLNQVIEGQPLKHLVEYEQLLDIQEERVDVAVILIRANVDLPELEE